MSLAPAHVGTSAVLTHGLRDWQARCLQDFTDYTSRAASAAQVHPGFLVTAPPGAGKTRAALACATHLFVCGHIDRVVIVSPTRQTTTQWAANLADPARMDTGAGPIRASSTATSIRRGRTIPTAVCLTYAALTRAAPLLSAGLDPERTLVILDEVHHASDHPDSTWGADCQAAFGPARFKIVLSGTPVRTDRKAIPFLDYRHEAGAFVAEADTDYDIAQAMADGVLRPLVCQGLASEVDYDGSIVDLAELRGPAEAHAYSATVRGERWLRPALGLAHRRLEAIRSTTHPHAAALVVCADTDHAAQVTDLLGQMGLGPVVSVDSSRVGSRADLARFATSSARWLVAVQMVSEGVDIPRLAVCLYATVQRTELMFRQISGRIMRTDGPEDSTTAVLVYPTCRTLDAHVGRFAHAQRPTATIQAPGPGGPGIARGEQTVQPLPQAWASGELTSVHYGATAAPVLPAGPWSAQFEQRLEQMRLTDPSAGPQEVLRAESARLFKRYTEALHQHRPEVFDPDQVIYRQVNRWARDLLGQPAESSLEELIVRTSFVHLICTRMEQGYPLHQHEGAWWPVREGRLQACVEAMSDPARLPEWMQHP